MKKRYLNIVVFALFVSMLWGCSDWTKPEAEDFFEMPGNDYYENLRAYKRSEHSVAFGWFGGWTGWHLSEELHLFHSSRQCDCPLYPFTYGSGHQAKR